MEQACRARTRRPTSNPFGCKQFVRTKELVVRDLARGRSRYSLKTWVNLATGGRSIGFRRLKDTTGAGRTARVPIYWLRLGGQNWEWKGAAVCRWMQMSDAIQPGGLRPANVTTDGKQIICCYFVSSLFWCNAGVDLNMGRIIPRE